MTLLASKSNNVSRYVRYYFSSRVRRDNQRIARIIGDNVSVVVVTVVIAAKSSMVTSDSALRCDVGVSVY